MRNIQQSLNMYGHYGPTLCGSPAYLHMYGDSMFSSGMRWLSAGATSSIYSIYSIFQGLDTTLSAEYKIIGNCNLNLNRAKKTDSKRTDESMQLTIQVFLKWACKNSRNYRYPSPFWGKQSISPNFRCKSLQNVPLQCCTYLLDKEINPDMH
jgi:hypothetical protein